MAVRIQHVCKQKSDKSRKKSDDSSRKIKMRCPRSGSAWLSPVVVVVCTIFYFVADRRHNHASPSPSLSYRSPGGASSVVTVVEAYSSAFVPTFSKSIPTSATTLLSSGRGGRIPTFLKSNRWDRDIDDNASRRRKAKSGGVGETAAGAILGGLLLGPFGALFGASIGSNIGAKNAAERARREEMERLGITQDMLDAAQDIGMSLERSNEGLKATQESLETQQRFARRLDAESSELYDKAKAALGRSDDEAARELLMKRQQVLDKLKVALKKCADERKRLETMERNVSILETRAMEVDALLRRTVSAKTAAELATTTEAAGLALSDEDPLLRKFRDQGIDY